MSRQPPRPTRTYTLLPYPTLFRSLRSRGRPRPRHPGRPLCGRGAGGILRGVQRVPLQRSAPPAGNIADGGRAHGPSLRRVAAGVGRGYAPDGFPTVTAPPGAVGGVAPTYARFDDFPFPLRIAGFKAPEAG